MTTQPEHIRRGISKRFTQVAMMMVVIAVLLFAPAGRLDWMWAWAFIGLYVAMTVITSVVLLRLSPATIAARAEATGQRGWDRLIGSLWALATLASLAVAGLDQRWGWTPQLQVGWQLLGALGFVAGLGLFLWAMATNAAFATVARIGPSDQHRVCSTGPYHWVRHPGYVGAIVQAFATPLFLGSAWALVPGLVAAMAMIVRTSLEDAMLRAELPGYETYSRQVRFRLAPGLW